MAFISYVITVFVKKWKKNREKITIELLYYFNIHKYWIREVC